MLHFIKEGSGPLIIFLHGLLGSHDNWGFFVRQFSQRYTVIAPDLINHGDSPHDSNISLHSMADDVFELIHAHNYTNALCIGHSLGGKVALNLALRYPAYIEGLVVVDVAPKAYDSGKNRIIFSAMQEVIAHGAQTRGEAERILAHKISDKAMRLFLLKNFIASKWRVNVTGLIQLADVLSGWRPIKQQYTKPALAVIGTKSDYVLQTDYPLLTTYLPNVTFHELNSGHWVHAENTDAFSRVIGNFIESVYPQTAP